jgi:hypothetical protein
VFYVLTNFQAVQPHIHKTRITLTFQSADFKLK